MRKPKFLSPSSKSRWLSNRTGFYLKYLADTKMPREPQAIYMGVGSGFDARVKSEIAHQMFGKPEDGDEFHFETLFEKQVEHHHRDRSLDISTRVWEAYSASGAFEALMEDVRKSPTKPEMEQRVENTVAGVPLLGLPDLEYTDWRSELKVINDWKIMGSNPTGSGASPPQGYMIVRDGWTEGKPSKQHGEPHKKHEVLDLNGMPIGKTFLEDFSLDWADQMSTYAWLRGAKVGSEDFIVRIECAACRYPKKNPEGRIKWSTHMNRVSATHQIGLIRTYKEIWSCIEDGHIFKEMSKEDSQARCDVLEMQAAAPQSTHKALAGMGADTGNFWMRTG